MAGADPIAHADAALAEAAAAAISSAAEPLTLAALHKRLRRRWTALSESELLASVQALIEGGRVHAWPILPGARAPRYGTRPPDPKDYLKAPVRAALAAVERELSRLMALGLPREPLVAAARALIEENALFAGQRETPADAEPTRCEALHGSALEQAVLDSIRRLAAGQRHGGLVSTRELRLAMTPRLPDPQSLDAALLALAKRGTAWLYRHDYPAGLSEAERAAMVSDGQGHYYNGVSLKE